MFPQLTVRNKLLAGFGSTFVLLAIMVWLSISGLATLNKGLLEVTQGRYPKVLLANTAIKHALDVDRLVRSLLVTSDAEAITHNIEQIEKARSANTEVLNKMEKLLVDENGRERFRKILETRKALSAQYSRLFEMARAGDASALSAFVAKDFARPNELFITSLEEMAAFQDKAISDEMHNAEATYGSVLTVVISASVLILIVGTAVALLLAGMIARPLRQALQMSGEIAAGNLTSQVVAERKTGKDETLLLMNALEDMRMSLRSLIASMQTDASQVANSAFQLTAMAEQVAVSAQRQSEASSSAAATIEELTVSIAHVADNAGEASAIAQSAGATASAGSGDVKTSITRISQVERIVGETSEQMAQLSREVAQIDSIVTVIRDVAEQTNLLALNAAIEAARAGETGRGFAVVADEVRKLAERSATSAHEITNVIRSIQAGTQKVADSMKESQGSVALVSTSADTAGQSMQEIEHAAQQVVDTIHSISAALNQQRTASQNLAQSVEQVAQMSDENAQTVEVLANTSTQLKDLSGNLQSAASRFRV